MIDLAKRITDLSPEKRELLLQRLNQEVRDVSQTQIKANSRGAKSLPLSFAQQRLWVLNQLEPDSSTYNLPYAFRLKGLLDSPALERSLGEILRRHEILRTTFLAENGQPVQVITPNTPLVMSVVDLRERPQSERETKLQQLVNEEAQRPFDLVQGPLLRTNLLCLSEEEHILLLTMHHIVSDGWSRNVLMRELTTLYEAFSTGKPSPLSELPIQYADFAIWQRQWLQGEVQEAQLTYWKKQLDGAPPVLELPTDRPRPVVQTFHGVRQSVMLSQTLAEALKELGQREGGTLFMVLLTAFKILLYRYSGQEDLVVGSPIANRNRAEIEGLIGFFVNTLVLRTDLSGNPTFQELLGRVREVALGAYDHQDLPFEKLVEELQPERNLSHSPLFQVMFGFVRQSTLVQVPKLAGLTVNRLEMGRTTAMFDLTLSMVQGVEGLKAVFEYNTDLFDAATIERMMGHFRNLLEGVVANPEQHILDLPLLTEAEQHQLLFAWNDTQADYPHKLCIHQLFEAQVEQSPNAIAVIFEDQQLSYWELNQQANRLAHHLRTLGVGADVLVGICMERSLEMLVGLLGILKAGGTYVPLDPAYPQERLAFMLSDSQARVLLTQQRLAKRLPEHEAEVVCLDTIWEAITANAGESEVNLATEVKSDDLAYVIYTSGSTGKPKGVQIPHRAAVNFLHSMSRQPGLTDQDILLAVTTLSFDIALLELFLPLSVGAQVVVVSSEVASDGEQLLEKLTNSGATVMQATPATWHLLLETGWQGNKQLKILCGGEALLPDLANKLLDKCASLWNMYGPTETTVWSAICQFDSEDRPISIGRPIDNTQIYILDARLQLVPIGVPGELYIGGDGLARGYLNRPNLTAEKFISHPLSDEPAARIYNTGDLARYLPDGSIECLGRIDHQVKVRGFRIELGEIEAVLGQHPALDEAVVIVREDNPGDKRLVAYLIVDQESTPSTSELRRLLAERLPDYMVPSAFVFLDALPLTPNRKVDRRALPAPDQTRPDLEKAFVAPRNPMEQKLTKIWADVLGLEQVGIHDNFFELGGHSLLATQLIFQLQIAFQVELSLRSLFKAPTVADLAAIIVQEKDKLTEYTPLPTIVPAPEERYKPFPLTDIQQAYWIGRSSSFELGDVASHTYKEIETTDLDLEQFELALQRLIERHGMLRAVVSLDGQQQILEQVPPYRIKVLDLREQDSKHIAAQLEAVRAEMSHQILPSDQWPLFDIRASRLDEQKIRLHISFDLLIADAQSFRIFYKELFQLYRNPDISLASLELSFRDCVVARGTLQDSETYQRSKDYWLSRLRSLPPAPELPLAKSPGSVTHHRFVRRSSRLEPETWDRLRVQAARADLTPSGVLLAAFAEVLNAWSKNSRFTLNLTLFNRLPLHPQINDIMGDFTSVTLLEVDNSAEPTFEARARHLQQQLWDDLDHRYVSGVQVIRELARQQGGNPGAVMPIIFTSGLVHDTQNTDPSPMSWLGDIVYSVSQTPQVWLDHMVREEAGLAFNWDTLEELFPEGLLDDMFNAYCCLLHRLADEEESWQESWPEMMEKLVPPAQLEQRTVINATEAPISAGLLHTFFTDQVPQRRNEPAVITPKRTLSYEELYNRSNQVGHWLRQREARPNALVAVVMEKGWEQVVAVLGIHASGAAYLPIDATLPKERLWYLLEHGQVSLVLTQSWYDNELEWPEGIQRLCVDQADQFGLDESPLEPVQGPEDLAYVIYTSGSTGLPKGVVIDHRGAVNTILDVNQRFEVGPEDRVLALSALNFDLSVYDIFGMLAAGGTIVMPAAFTTRDPAHWAKLLVQDRVTIWNTVPALMQMLVEYLAGRPEELPDSLRLVMMSGDWVPVDLPDRIKAMTEDIQVFSLGGATEASIWSILYPIEQVDPAWTSIPYGRPMVNQSFQVLNEALAPCPVWVPGQLYIGGIGLAKGYWRDEEKTQASFITHSRTGERLYRTGDLGRYLPDGNLEFLGRDDFQVKIRGHRIELGEIETALLQHPGVHTAVVAAAGELRGNKRLVAYVVPEQKPVSTNHKQESLPDVNLVEDTGSYQAEEVLRDPLERLRFKLKKPGVRQENNSSSVQLIKPELDEALSEAYLSRRSYRKYTETPVPFEQFSTFLSSLLQVEIEGAPFPKYQYGSAGGLYPVQAYLYIKPNRVEGLSAGTYYYHPGSHRLVLLSAEAQIDRSDFPENQAIFDEAAFALFFVGQLNAISPLYGGHARDFCMLEAGLISQLLETSAPANQIGLCQIGGFDFQPIRHLFALEESHLYLHCLLGGRINTDQTSLQAFVEDFREFRPFLDLVDRETNKGADSASDQLRSSSMPLVTRDSKSDRPLAEELQDFLREKLPDYMVPANFMLLDALPLSANGKVDRKALPEPDSLEPESVVAHVDPQTVVERAIASIWQEVLQVEQVGIHDNFFDLGGNSVHVVQVHAKIREVLQEDVPIIEMFNHPTISTLAEHLNQEREKQDPLEQSHNRAETRRALRKRRRQAKHKKGNRDE